MSDLVNDYFRRFYPDDWASNYEMEYCVGDYERRYQDRASDTIFPLMKLADGLELSVQGHWGAYSTPRGDFEESYSRVEIMGPPDIPEFAGISREPCGDRAIYGFVDVALVCALIEARGGIVNEEFADA